MLYSKYKQLAEQKGLQIPAQTYMAVAVFYCQQMESDKVLSVLTDLNEDNFEPTPVLCEPLLRAALSSCDAKVLRILLSWYTTHFNLRLEFGQMARVLTIAANIGDSQLALVTFKMLKSSGCELTGGHYACLVRSLMLSSDIISTVEALQEMEIYGIQFTETVTTTDAEGNPIEVRQFWHKQYSSFKNKLVSIIVGPPSPFLFDHAKRRLDNIYYALVEQASQNKDDKNNSSSNSNNDRNYIDSTIASSSSSTANSINRNIIPRIVLDALIEAAGQLGMTDRAFATFQEYRTLFHRIPDIHTYNSLLTGVSFCRVTTLDPMRTLLSIFQDIEETEAVKESDPQSDVVVCKPDGKSFSILLEAMVRHDDFKVLDQVFEYMQASNIAPSPRSLRRLISALAQRGDWDRVGKVRAELVKHSVGLSAVHYTDTNGNNGYINHMIYDADGFPIYLERRLNRLKAIQNDPPQKNKNHHNLTTTTTNDRHQRPQ